MAKKSMIAREKRRREISVRHFEARQALKKQVIDPNATQEERWEAVKKLQKRRRDQSHVRVSHICDHCGRPRGVLRKFRLCRCCLRLNWMRGEIIGLVKASW